MLDASLDFRKLEPGDPQHSVFLFEFNSQLFRLVLQGASLVLLLFHLSALLEVFLLELVS